MKIDLQYVNDTNGNPQAVQLALTTWKKVMNKLKKYEQAFKLRSDLQKAFDQVEILKVKKRRSKH